MRNFEKVYFAELKMRKIFLLLSYVTDLVKESRDPSMRSQRHFSILISTLRTGTSFKFFFRYALSTATLKNTCIRKTLEIK